MCICVCTYIICASKSLKVPCKYANDRYTKNSVYLLTENSAFLKYTSNKLVNIFKLMTYFSDKLKGYSWNHSILWENILFLIFFLLSLFILIYTLGL